MSEQTPKRRPRRTSRSAAERRRARKMRIIRRLTLSAVVCILALAIVVKLLVFAVSGIGHALHKSADPKPALTETVEQTEPEQPAEPEPEPVEPASVSLIAVGDNLIHNTLLLDALQSDGSYDFNSMYDQIKPYVEAADIAVINQESPLGTGEPSAYPCFNTPQACGDAVVNAGFDVISHANNHAMDSGAEALYDTLDFWDSYADKGIVRIGIARNAEDRAKVRFVERNGMKIGFLAYTYGLNGYSLPDNNPDLVSLIDKDKIAQEMAAVKEQCDAVVVLMHWGEEYETAQNEEEEDLAQFLTENGADLIIGGHPHVMQPCAWVQSPNGNRTFCAYSLGNFVSAQDTAYRMTEGMLQVTISRKEDGSIVVEHPGVMPMVCTFSGWRNYKVIPLDDYTDSMAANHSLAGSTDMSVSNLHSIANAILGEYCIPETVPTTYAKKSKKADS